MPPTNRSFLISLRNKSTLLSRALYAGVSFQLLLLPLGLPMLGGQWLAQGLLKRERAGLWLEPAVG